MKFQLFKKSYYNVDNMILIFFSLVILFVFCLWDVVQCLGGLCDFYGPASVTPSVFSEINSWLPLAMRVSQGNFFPIQPSIDPYASGFSFFPYISIWFQGVTIALLGLKGSYIFGHTLLPFASFILLYFIFKKYLFSLWSSFFAFIALISFSNLPFRYFLLGLFQGKPVTDISTLQPLAIAGFPFPAFSLFLFLLVFFLSIESKKLTQSRLFVLTCCWALQSQVHVFSAFVGLLFWFLFFPIRLYRENHKISLVTLSKTICTQFFLAVIMLLPSLLAYSYVFVSGYLSLSELGVSSIDSQQIFNEFYGFLYFAFPLILTVIVAILSKTDPFELIFKFSPVFILLFIEAAFFIFCIITGISLPSNLIFSRLGLLFFHFYYLVPAIYYLSHRLTTFHFTRSQNFLNYIRKILALTSNRLSSAILPALVIFLVLFAIFSARRSYENTEKQDVITKQKTKKIIDILTQNLPVGSAALSEDAVVNLLIPIVTQNSTLWVDRFSNHITQEEAIERFAFIAHVYNWNLKYFIEFMSPGKIQQITEQNHAIQLDNTNLNKSGVGFWLTMHRSSLSKEEYQKYTQKLVNKYKTINILQLLEKFKVRRILSLRPLSNLPAEFIFSKTSLGYLYSNDRKSDLKM